jgi:hypothetical protein
MDRGSLLRYNSLNYALREKDCYLWQNRLEQG